MNSAVIIHNGKKQTPGALDQASPLYLVFVYLIGVGFLFRMFYIIFCLQADTHRAGFGAITATCTNPSGHVLDIMVRKTDDDKFDIPFNPHEKGTAMSAAQKKFDLCHSTSGGSSISQTVEGISKHIFDNNFA